MNIKVDENLPLAAVDLLEAHGHNVTTVYEEDLAGAADTDVLEACQKEARVLVTLDLDFSDLRLYPPSQHPGIMVLRPSTESKEQILRLLARTMALLESETIDRRLWIVEPNRLRIRE